MRTVRLCEVVDPEGRIEDRTYEDVHIIGPAILALDNDNTFDNCRFDGAADHILIELEAGRTVTGVVVLHNVTFRKCRFTDVGIVGTRETIDQFRVAGLHDEASPVGLSPD